MGRRGRDGRVRAFEKGPNVPFPQRLDRVPGFAQYSKLEKEQLTPSIKAHLNISSIDELCWVCELCSHRNGCQLACAAKNLNSSVFTAHFQPTLPNLFSPTTPPVDAVTTQTSTLPPASLPVPAAVGGEVEEQQSPVEDEEEAEHSLHKQQSEYVFALAKEHFLPNVRHNGRFDPTKLTENGIISDCFICPLPRQFPNLIVGGKRIADIPVAWACSKAVVQVLDYELFEESCTGFTCECKEKLTRNGYSNYARIESGFGTSTRFFVTVEYICAKKCKLEGTTKTTTYNTLSQHILGQLNEAVRSSLDFVVTSDKTVVSRSTMNTIVASMEQGGCGFGNLADVSYRVVGTEMVRDIVLTNNLLKIDI